MRDGKGQPAIQSYVEHLATLKKQWEIKGDDHKKAREFFYKSWPTLRSAVELKANIAEAKKALAACIKAGDPLTPRMLLRTNTNHFNRLAERLKAVADSDNPDERNEGKAILEVRTDLEELTKQASDFIQSAKEYREIDKPIFSADPGASAASHPLLHPLGSGSCTRGRRRSGCGHGLPRA